MPPHRALRLCPPLALALTLGVALPACTGSDGTFPVWVYSDDGDLLPKASGGGLVVDPDSPIPDVPKPIGFIPLPSKSSVSTTLDGERNVTHVYQGRANRLDAAAFYRRNLDDHGWTTAGLDQGDPRSTVQSYSKGPENLRINITQDRSVVTIRANITPASEPAAGSMNSGRALPRGASASPTPAPPLDDPDLGEPLPEPLPVR